MKFLVLALSFFTLSVQADDSLRSKERVVLRTDLGDLVLILFPTLAPQTVRQFLRLVEGGIYDGTHFFRIHPGFVAQVSDAHQRLIPLRPEQKKLIRKIPAEFSTLRHRFGILSMARHDHDPNSGEVSFSILLGPAPHLDEKYTVFGQVEKGSEILVELQRLSLSAGYAPHQRVTIHEARVAHSEVELAQLLATPVPAVSRELASQPAPLKPWALVFLALWVAAVSILLTLLGSRVPIRSFAALNLANLLVAAFCLLVTFGPRLGRSPVLGLSLCLGLLVAFRLLSRFETA